MMITTTSRIEGKQILEYKGIVFGEVIAGVNFVKDFMADIRDFVGGRSSTYEGEVIKVRKQALEEMQQRARQLGANAIVGVDVDYEVLGESGSMLMISASGIAVVTD